MHEEIPKSDANKLAVKEIDFEARHCFEAQKRTRTWQPDFVISTGVLSIKGRW